MKRISKRVLVVVAICCLVAIGFAWGAARFAASQPKNHVTQNVSGEVASNEQEAEKTQTGSAVTQLPEPSEEYSSEPTGVSSTQSAGMDAPEETSPDYEPPLVLSESAKYEPGVVLVTVDPLVSPDELNALLAETGMVATKEIADEDIKNGLIKLEVASGHTVEDAVNILVKEEALKGVQPNYVYHLQLGNAADLQARLASIELEEPALTLLGDDGLPETGDAEISFAEAEDSVTDELDAYHTNDSSNEADLVSDDETEGPEDSESTADEEGQSFSEEGEQLLADDESNVDEQLSDKDADEKDSTSPQMEEEAESDLSLMSALAPNDPLLYRQWALTSINAPLAWGCVRSEGGVTVAVIDQYPDLAHEDLEGNVVGAYDAVTKSTTYTLAGQHGTHVAGIVSAVSDNGKGVAGVSCNAKLLCVNVFPTPTSRETDTMTVVDGINFAAEHAEEYNVRIMNLSLGNAGEDDELLDNAVIDAFENHGIVVVSAAGNQDLFHLPPFSECPADLDCVVSVINLQSYNGVVTRSAGSNYNMPGETAKNISAPGTDVLSTVPNDNPEKRYEELTGTSMASPQVAGVLALIFSADPSLSASDAINILYATAKDLGDEGWDEEYGYGEVDAFAAVLATQSWRDATLTLEDMDCTYTGEAVTPKTILTLDDGTVLTEGVDYDVSYSANVDVGTAAAIAVGKGDYEGKGFVSTEFTITPAPIEGATVVVEKGSMRYEGKSLKPGVTVKMGDKKLTIKKDYTVSYANNKNVSTPDSPAIVTVTGTGNYRGEVHATFTIVPAPITYAMVTLEKGSLPYTGEALEPGVATVRLGSTPLSSKDYTVSYKNNVYPGTATVIVTGKGNYCDSATTTFRIVGDIVFSDVTVNTAHVDDIVWLSIKGVSAGWRMSDGSREFRPYANVARADMAAFLFRLAKTWGLVDDSWQPSGSVTFQDVTPQTSHYREIMWLAETGISQGWTTKTGQREFRPLANVARADMAAFLFRLAKLKGLVNDSWQPSGSVTFRDVKQNTPHYREVMWLAETGVSQGWTVSGGKEFRPYANVARADMAAFLHRLDILE